MDLIQRVKLIVGLGLACASGSAVAQTLPIGFVDFLVMPGLIDPTGLAHLPDGRIVLTEQSTGSIRLIAGSASVVIATVPGAGGVGERGLLGIAVDPQWPARAYLYVHYNHAPTSTIRVTRLRFEGDLLDPLSTELHMVHLKHIIENYADQSPIHNGGTVRFGPDGMLYVSLGDDESPCAAQMTNETVGRILRLDVSSISGSGPGAPPRPQIAPPNPNFGGPPEARLTFALGLRNPFRFHIDPVTGAVLIADVGAAAFEEIDIAYGGENFGWPWREGLSVGAGCGGSVPNDLVSPLVALERAPNPGPAAVISLAVYRNQTGGMWSFGPEYEGSYFYTDFYHGRIRRLHWDGTSWLPAPPVNGQPTPTDWATGYSWVTDGSIGPDGALYYVRRFPAELRMIRPDGEAPTLAVVSGNDQVGNGGQPLLDPLVVRLTDNASVPTPDVMVTFTESTGQGFFVPTSVLTDANGEASAYYVLPATASVNPAILVSAANGATTSFNARWRGLLAEVLPGPPSALSIVLVHSEAASPFTLAAEPATGLTYHVTPVGNVMTSVLDPLPGLYVLDGLGMVFPPDPSFRTPSGTNAWIAHFEGIPVFGNLTLTVQAYAVDTTLLPSLAAVLVSNPVTLTLP